MDVAAFSCCLCSCCGLLLLLLIVLVSAVCAIAAVFFCLCCCFCCCFWVADPNSHFCSVWPSTMSRTMLQLIGTPFLKPILTKNAGFPPKFHGNTLPPPPSSPLPSPRHPSGPTPLGLNFSGVWLTTKKHTLAASNLPKCLCCFCCYLSIFWLFLVVCCFSCCLCYFAALLRFTVVSCVTLAAAASCCCYCLLLLLSLLFVFLLQVGSICAAVCTTCCCCVRFVVCALPQSQEFYNWLPSLSPHKNSKTNCHKICQYLKKNLEKHHRNFTRRRQWEHKETIWPHLGATPLGQHFFWVVVDVVCAAFLAAFVPLGALFFAVVFHVCAAAAAFSDPFGAFFLFYCCLVLFVQLASACAAFVVCAFYCFCCSFAFLFCVLLLLCLYCFRCCLCCCFLLLLRLLVGWPAVLLTSENVKNKFLYPEKSPKKTHPSLAARFPTGDPASSGERVFGPHKATNVSHHFHLVLLAPGHKRGRCSLRRVIANEINHGWLLEFFWALHSCVRWL